MTVNNYYSTELRDTHGREGVKKSRKPLLKSS
jgi:hypothetical protein